MYIDTIIIVVVKLLRSFSHAASTASFTETASPPSLDYVNSQTATPPAGVKLEEPASKRPRPSQSLRRLNALGSGELASASPDTVPAKAVGCAAAAPVPKATGLKDETGKGKANVCPPKPVERVRPSSTPRVKKEDGCAAPCAYVCRLFCYVRMSAGGSQFQAFAYACTNCCLRGCCGPARCSTSFAKPGLSCACRNRAKPMPAPCSASLAKPAPAR